MKKNENVLYCCCVCLLFFCCLTGCIAEKSVSAETGKPQPAQSVHNSFRTLSELTDRFAADLFQATGGTSKLYLDRLAIRDTHTGDVAHFSSYLENELEASLSGQGFQLVEEPYEAENLVGAVFQRNRDRMRIFFKYHRQGNSDRKAMDYTIAKEQLPPDVLKENIRSKAYKLAVDMAGGQQKMTVFLRPIKNGNDQQVTDFSRAFSARFKNEFVRLKPNVILLDEQPIKRRLANTRGIKKNVKKVKDVSQADAALADADAVLTGHYFIENNIVNVAMTLTGLSGRVLATADVDIDRDMIGEQLIDSTAAKLADLADVAGQERTSKIKIFTSHGADAPIYHRGENIVFHLQVTEPLYVYIYDIDSEGRVELLYPYTVNAVQQPFLAGRLYSLPALDDEFELTVEPPFGMDAVKVFASPTQLPLPQISSSVSSQSYRGNTRGIKKNRKKIQKSLANTNTINPKDLVDFYVGTAARTGLELLQDTVMVQTKP